MKFTPVIHCSKEPGNEKLNDFMRKVYSVIISSYLKFDDVLPSIWWNVNCNIGLIYHLALSEESSTSVSDVIYIGSIDDGDRNFDNTVDHDLVSDTEFINFYLIPSNVSDPKNLSPTLHLSLSLEFVGHRKRTGSSPDMDFIRFSKGYYTEGINYVLSEIKGIIRNDEYMALEE